MWDNALNPQPLIAGSGRHKENVLCGRISQRIRCLITLLLIADVLLAFAMYESQKVQDVAKIRDFKISLPHNLATAELCEYYLTKYKTL